MYFAISLHSVRPVVPNLFEVGEHLLIKKKFGSAIMTFANFWEHLLLGSWEQFGENSRDLHIFGSTR